MELILGIKFLYVFGSDLVVPPSTFEKGLSFSNLFGLTPYSYSCARYPDNLDGAK